MRFFMSRAEYYNLHFIYKYSKIHKLFTIPTILNSYWNKLLIQNVMRLII